MATVTTPSVAVSPAYSSLIRTPPAIVGKRTFGIMEQLPTWRGELSTNYSGAAFMSVDKSGVISGKVTLDETPVPYADVFLFYLPAMLLIRTGRTDINGDYWFYGLDKSSNKYVAVARIPPHNAMILDTLTPA